MISILESARLARFVAVASIATCASLACGGSTTSAAGPNIGAGGDVGASGAGGTGAQAGVGATAGNQGVKLAPGSWQMTAVVTETQPNPSVMPCASLSFTLNVAQDGSGYSATLGQNGFIDAPTADIRNNAYLLGGFYLPCGNQLTLSGLTLQGSDTDGDGVADQLSGFDTAMAYSGGGDLVASEAVQVTFTGTRDTSPPTLVTPVNPVDPLLPFVISASEPLTATASLGLVGTSNLPLTAQPATATAQGTPITASINWSTNVILPLAGQWQVQGTGQDLVGHALMALGTLTTLGDPGVFAQDGFEGALIAAIDSGSPTLVKGIGSVTAISGAQSLWLVPGDALTFHLKRASSEKTLRFSARAFGSYGPPSVTADIRAGVVGGQQIAMPSFAPSTMSIDTGDANWKEASEVLEFTVPLMDAGPDVLFYLSPTQCTGFCAPPSPLMVDDLTLE